MKRILTIVFITISVHATAQRNDTEQKNVEVVDPTPLMTAFNGARSERVIDENTKILAFLANRPLAPVHILIIPDKRITTLNELIAVDSAMVSEMISAATKPAYGSGISKTECWLVLNTNEHACQAAFQIDLPLLIDGDGTNDAHAMVQTQQQKLNL